ncbi:hypothetical protein DB346_13005 [Verrucomicrobia bacterium LW23]|nr:hypothetical protein DB346_13005 [Verrucomicrobia bacterium LW23]
MDKGVVAPELDRRLMTGGELAGGVLGVLFGFRHLRKLFDGLLATQCVGGGENSSPIATGDTINFNCDGAFPDKTGLALPFTPVDAMA